MEVEERIINGLLGMVTSHGDQAKIHKLVNNRIQSGM